MKRLSLLFATGLAVLGLSGNVLAQGLSDLLGSDSSSGPSGTPEVRHRYDRRRADLFVTGDAIPHLTTKDRDEKEVGISADLDLDFVCGKFDLRGTFENLLTKEVREEFLGGLLGYLESEITGSAMELLCQAQPTLCTLLQNHNIAANLKLGYHYDRCAEIERAIDHAHKRVYANAYEKCLREKEAAGVPLDRALEACRRVKSVQGLDGGSRAEFDLGREIRRFVRIDEGANPVLDSVAEDLRYDATSASSRPNPDGLPREFRKIREEYLKRFWEATVAAQEGGLTPEEVRKLVPEGLPSLDVWQLLQIGRLPAASRRSVLGSLASAYAMTRMLTLIHEAERALEALMDAPTIDEGQRKTLAQKRDRLRNEYARLRELSEGYQKVQDAQRRAKALTTENHLSEVERQHRRWRARRRESSLRASVEAWGRSTPRRSVPRRQSGHAQGSLCEPGSTGTTLEIGSFGN